MPFPNDGLLMSQLKPQQNYGFVAFAHSHYQHDLNKRPSTLFLFYSTQKKCQELLSKKRSAKLNELQKRENIVSFGRNTKMSYLSSSFRGITPVCALALFHGLLDKTTNFVFVVDNRNRKGDFGKPNFLL